MTPPPPSPSARGASAPDPSAPDPSRSGGSRRRLRLDTFRRYCFFSIVVSLGGLLWLGAVPALAALDAPPWSGIALMVGLVGVSAALWFLADRHVPLSDGDRARPRRVLPPSSSRMWDAVGWAAAVLASAGWIVRTDLAFWNAPLIVMVALAMVPWSRRRQVVVAVLGTVVLIVVGLGSVGGLADPTADAAGAQVVGTIVLMSVVVSAVLASVWTWEVAAELDAARGTAAALAVADERLRFAGELHDIQGHHLQVIALKSELAARLTDRDPERARAEMEQVRELAATALTETRQLVHGYRRTSLTAELSNASNVLTSAAIDARVDSTVRAIDDELDAHRRHLLGLVVREATTNVLRHSAASWARFELGSAEGNTVLRISNDRPSASSDGGSGLASLRERLAAAGGTLTTTRAEEVFRLEVALPAGAPADATAQGAPSVARGGGA